MFKNYKSNVLSSIFRMDKVQLFPSLFVMLVVFTSTTFSMSLGNDIIESLSISLPILIIFSSGIYSMLSLIYSSTISMNLSIEKSVFGRHFIVYNWLVGVIFSFLIMVIVTLFIKLSLINVVMLFIFLFASISFYSSLFLAAISVSSLFTSNFLKLGTVISQIIALLISTFLSIGVHIIITKIKVLMSILKSSFIGNFYIVVIILFTLSFLFRVIFTKNYSKLGFEINK